MTAVIVMGVSGSGKSSLAMALAARLDVPFCEGDDLHAAAAIAKMRAGIALTDADRQPWLDRVGAWLAGHAAGGVASCSALRRGYRDRLRAACPGVAFVLLDADRATLLGRITARSGHFMPADLLDSQLATLERPAPDEQALTLDATQFLTNSIDLAVAWLERTATGQP